MQHAIHAHRLVAALALLAGGGLTAAQPAPECPIAGEPIHWVADEGLFTLFLAVRTC
ncbi:MAG TPA: hypothetical protein VKD22_09415 [Ramlibacter sp.]|nr:hypothetical protein [Ramlibacter sp.]